MEKYSRLPAIISLYMRDVIVIGSATSDVFLKTSLPKIEWDCPFGKAVVLPLGEKMSAEGIVFTSGGNAMNASVTFRRQKLKTAAVMRVGSDEAGRSVMARLDHEGIDRKLSRFIPDIPTSYSAIFLEDGERSIVNFKGAGEIIDSSAIDSKKMKAKWWYVSLPGKSYILLPKIIREANKAGARIALNPTGYHIKKGKDSLIKSLKGIDALIVNESEAAEITGIPWSDSKAVFKKLDILVDGIAAVTSGSAGCSVSDGFNIYKAGIFKERKFIDRTGAGDAFGSGFIAGLIKKGWAPGESSPEDISYAIRLGSANASSVVEQIGASEGALRDWEFNDLRFRKLDINISKLKK